MFFMFFFWRFIDFAVAIISPNFIPYLGFFAHRIQLITSYNLPSIITSLANFDGIYYLRIAQYGYSQYEQAFFPLYPLLIRFLTPIVKNPLIAGLLISNISFFFGLIVLLKYFSNNKYPITNNLFLLLFFLTFPTSFFFGAVYTESLFFLLTISSLYFLKKENYVFAGICAFFSSLTRFAGIFLVIPILCDIITKYKKQKNITNNKYPITLLSPLLGLSVYSLYLWKAFGNPFLFFTAQSSFGLNRSTSIILLPQVIYRYIKIFLTASWNFQYAISVFEFLVFFLVFTVLIADFLKAWQGKNFSRLGLNLFSFANILVPTLTGTFLSIPRFALLSISFFLYLAELKSVWVKIAIAGIFFAAHITALAFFIQGYFIS